VPPGLAGLCGSSSDVGIAALLDALRPWSTGFTMVNFHGHPGDATDRARAWPPEIYEMITTAKRRYDPDNMMRFGHAVSCRASIRSRRPSRSRRDQQRGVTPRSHRRWFAGVGGS